MSKPQTAADLPPPPRLPGLPLLGNTLDLLTKDTKTYFIDAYRQHGPVFKINFLFKDYTVLAGAEALDHFTKSNEKGLSRRAFFGAMDEEVGGVVLLSEPLGTFQHLRGQARIAFSRQLASEFIGQIIAAVDTALDQHPPGRGKAAEVSVMDFTTRIAFDEYSRLMCGESLAAHYESAQKYAHWVMNIGVKKWPKWSARLPAYKKARAEVIAMIESVLDSYERRPADHGMPYTILDALMDARTDDGEPLARNDLIATIQYGIIGTIIYMNRTISFLLHDLLSNPEAYARVREEVASIYAAGPPDSLGLRGMSVLRGALKESMRLHPVSLGMPFMVDESFAFNGHAVEKGLFCVYTGVPAHYAPNFYPQPDRFEPDRCRAPRNEHKQRGAYAPYGFGRRLCPAVGLVETLVLCTVSRIIHRREMVMVPEGDPLRTVLSPLPGPDNRFRIRFTEERTDQESGGADRWKLAANALEELFGGDRLRDPLLRERLGRVQERRFNSGSLILRQGDTAEAFYVLVDGTIKVSAGREERPLAVLSAGAAFGEIGLLGEGRRTANCRASSDVVVLEMQRDDFMAIVRDSDLVPGEIAASVRQRYLADRAQQALPSLGADKVKSLIGAGDIQTVPAGEVIIRQGDEAENFYIVLTGRVDVSVAPEAGAGIGPGPSTAEVVATLGPGEFFGEIGILESRPRTATVTAATGEAVDLLVISRQVLLDLVEKTPQARADLASVMLERIVGGAREEPAAR
ncbi:cytochrome P450 [Fodinicurvata sp. EGI_FJ10296]|uniref:cytochrome P450 n=1 Tax=Fodinicurvata sp. EGI_FJ10296 TaxID=3231908 RepID=UPI0034559959